jgi:hypothetical protein
MFVTHRKHEYVLPRPVTKIDLLLYVDDVLPNSKHTYWPTRSVTGITLLFHVGESRTSQ